MAAPGQGPFARLPRAPSARGLQSEPLAGLAAGLSTETLSHAHTLAQAEAAGAEAGAVLAAVVQAIAGSNDG